MRTAAELRALEDEVAVGKFSCTTGTCKQPLEHGCRTASGNPAARPHAPRLRDARAYIKGSDDLQAELAQLRADYETSQRALGESMSQHTADAATITALQGQVTELEKYKAQHPEIPIEVVEPTHPITSAALYFHTTGSDANPGTRDKPRRTPLPFRENVALDGLYPDFGFTVPDGGLMTIVRGENEDSTVVFDGAGTRGRAFQAGGLLNLFHLTVQKYAPSSKSNGNNAPIYYGGTSAGSELDDVTVLDSKMAALGFQNRVNVRRFTARRCGYSGIMGASASGSIFEDILLDGVNAGGYAQDGQLGAMKLTWSTGVKVKGFTARGIPVANGFWLDAGCQDADLSDFDVDGTDTNGVFRMGHGVHFEITQGGALRRARIKGSAAGGGVMILSAGGALIEDVDACDNFVPIWLRQDHRNNNAGDTRNGTPAENPWHTRDVRLRNITMNGKHQLWCYRETNASDTIAAKDRIAEARGLWFKTPTAGGMPIRLENSARTLAQFQADLAAKAGPNYWGDDVAAAAAVRV